MVKSGLDPSENSNKEVPRVSQYRLATHLGLAFILYSIYLWTGLSHVFTPHDVSVTFLHHTGNQTNSLASLYLTYPKTSLHFLRILFFSTVK